MRLTTADLADRAERLLGVDIRITHGGRAHYYAPETGQRYWLTRADLAYAEDCARAYPGDAYSHWCAGTGREMSRETQRKIEAGLY